MTMMDQYELDRLHKLGLRRREDWLAQHMQDFITGLIAHGYSVKLNKNAPGLCFRIDFHDEAVPIMARLAGAENSPVFKPVRTASPDDATSQPLDGGTL